MSILFQDIESNGQLLTFDLLPDRSKIRCSSEPIGQRGGACTIHDENWVLLKV